MTGFVAGTVGVSAARSAPSTASSSAVKNRRVCFTGDGDWASSLVERSPATDQKFRAWLVKGGYPLETYGVDGGGKLHRVEGGVLKLGKTGKPCVTHGFGGRRRGACIVVPATHSISWNDHFKVNLPNRMERRVDLESPLSQTARNSPGAVSISVG